jgi:hypothetical protein
VGSEGLLAALKNWWARLKDTRETARQRKAEINQTLEAIIDMTGLNVRSVSGYAKKLRPALCAALEHVKAIEAGIPGVLEVSPRDWNIDPQVNALFVTPEETVPLFTQRGEAKAYFKESRPNETYALLTMDRADRTILTTDQQGSMVRRDIPRTSVTFKNHRIIALSDSEDETRAEIRKRCLKVLAELARDEITQLKSSELELKELENLYKVRLSMMSVQSRGAGLSPESERELHAETAEMRRSLEQVRGDLRQSRSSVEVHLQALKHALNSAPELLKGREDNVLLNEFSMIVKPGSEEKAHQVTLARICVGEEFRREAVLVRFKQSDFT